MNFDALACKELELLEQHSIDRITETLGAPVQWIAPWFYQWAVISDTLKRKDRIASWDFMESATF